MPESPCCCGITTVRKGSRLIGRLHFYSGICGAIIYIIVGLLLLITVQTDNRELDDFNDIFQKEFPLMHDSPRIYNILFYGYMLASIVASIYSGDILIKATLNHNMHYIKTWLKINAIIFILGLVFYIYSVMAHPSSTTVLNFLIFIAISVYLWSVVYQFYKDEKPSAF